METLREHEHRLLLMLDLQVYSLSICDDDNKDGGDAEDNDNDGEGQQCSFCVAQRLRGFLHTLHDVGRADFQDAAASAQVWLELLIKVQ